MATRHSTNFMFPVAEERVFLKKHGASIEEDWQRVNQLYQICDRLEEVVAPRPLFIEHTGKIIGYQYISGLIPLRCRPGNEDVFFRVGQNLARMHAQKLDENFSIKGLPSLPLHKLGLSKETSDSLLSNIPCGFFHGDLWHGNIFHLDDGSLVIVDPIPPGLLLPRSSLTACGAIDLATLHMSLYVMRKLSQYFTDIPRKVDEHARALLSGYLETYGAHSIARHVESISLALSRRWISQFDTRLSRPVACLKRQMSERAIRPMMKCHDLA